MLILEPQERNFLGIENKVASPEDADVIILPVPFEQTSSYGTGSDQGPAAIIDASRQVEFFDGSLGYDLTSTVDIATVTPLPVEACPDGEALANLLEKQVRFWLGAQKKVVTVGGEHTSVLGAIKAHCAVHNRLTVLQFDAHSDLRPAYEGSPWNHACAMARVLDFCDNIVQVGIRSECREEREAAVQQGYPVFHADTIHDRERSGIDWVGQVVAATAERVYITFDCDVFDPAVIPATGTPEPGGLTWQQVDRLIRALGKERQIVGFDISELAPIPGLHHPQFTMAKLIYRILGVMFQG